MTKQKSKPRTRRLPAPRAPRKHDGLTESRILDAARTVFIRRGTAGARMQEIAREAGVNQALLHYYFRSKERLSGAVFQQFASRMFPAVVQLLGGEASLADKIERIVALYLENLSANPFLPAYLLSELHHHPERVQQLLASAGASPERLMRPVVAKLAAQIDAEVNAGRMRPIAPEQFTANLLSLCVFPFAARPMLSIVFGWDDAAFARFIDERRRHLPPFIHAGLRP